MEDNPPEVFKTIGAPGTGKTTRVVGNPDIPDSGPSLVQENINEGYDLEDIFICTYTNAGVDEAEERLYAILDEPKGKIQDRVSTIHSQCFSTMGMSRDQVVSWWDKKKFCDTHDLRFQGGDSEDDIMSSEKPEGNSFYDIYGWLKSNRKDVEQYEDCPQPWQGDYGFPWLANKWEEYKNDRNLMDFSDMIEGVVEQAAMQLENLGWGVLFPDEDTSTKEMFLQARNDPNRDPDVIRGKGAFINSKVLFVDEVQDLTPLQWEWYLAQKLAMEKTYIGGDDDQTIYGWAGANPNFMLDEEGDFEVLDRTYRIPEKVWKACDGVIHQVDKRQEKDVEPHGDGGEVHTYRSPNVAEVIRHVRDEDGEVFILFRARYMINNFTDELHTAGIPYTNMSTFETWSDDVVTLRDALAKVDEYRRTKDESIKLSGDEVEVMTETAESHMVDPKGGLGGKEKAMANWGGLTIQEIKGKFKDSVKTSGEINYRSYLASIKEKDSLNYYEKEAIKGSITKGTADMYPDRVRIGTIHSSKGREAETVILALDSTDTIIENMMEDTRETPEKFISDAERRVYYVGMTRASENLVLVENLTGDGVTLSLDNLLAEGYEYAPEQAQQGMGDFQPASSKKEW